MLPSSLYLLRKFVNFKWENFVKFAVCPKCASLYMLESCTRRIRGQIVSNICSHRPFKKGSKRECATALVTKVVWGSGKVCFYPQKLYCFIKSKDYLNGLESLKCVTVSVCESVKKGMGKVCFRAISEKVAVSRSELLKVCAVLAYFECAVLAYFECQCTRLIVFQ